MHDNNGVSTLSIVEECTNTLTPKTSDVPHSAAWRSLGFLDHFACTRIINMEKRVDRRRETVQEFASHGFPLDTAHVQFFPAIAPESAAGFPSTGAHGCFRSHLAILCDALETKVGNILILEDDIAFTRDIQTTGSAAAQMLEQMDWDIAYFGHDKVSAGDPLRWVRVDQPMQTAHCYAVNRQVLQRLITFLDTVAHRCPGHPEGGPMHYDGALSTFFHQNPDIKAFYCSRNLAYQRPSKTDLHRPSVIDRNAFLRHFAAAYRCVKRAYLKRIR